jgi:hypothetical protein
VQNLGVRESCFKKFLEVTINAMIAMMDGVSRISAVTTLEAAMAAMFMEYIGGAVRIFFD